VNQLQQFAVSIEIPQSGPRGGYRAPLIKRYAVCAETNAEAVRIFREEMNVDASVKVTASSTLSRVIACA